MKQKVTFKAGTLPRYLVLPSSRPTKTRAPRKLKYITKSETSFAVDTTVDHRWAKQLKRDAARGYIVPCDEATFEFCGIKQPKKQTKGDKLCHF